MLEPLKFKDALYKGLGRARLLVRDHGDADVREILLDACMHHRALDPQIEGGRADWLHDMLEETGDPEFYRDNILDVLEGVGERTDLSDWDIKQLIDLAFEFAKRGHRRGRELLYRQYMFPAATFFPRLGADHIFQLDGLEGIARMAGFCGQRLDDESTFGLLDAVPRAALDEPGRPAILEFLSGQATRHEGLEAWLKEFREQLLDRPTRNGSHAKRTPPKTALEDLLALVDAKADEHPARFMLFGKSATREDLESIVRRLSSETDEEKLLRYLWVFRTRELPVLADNVFGALSSENEEVRLAAAVALSHTTDARIREAAHAMFERIESSTDLVGVVEMLAKNRAPGDCSMVSRRLPRDIVFDRDARDDYHRLSWAVVCLIEERHEHEVIPLLRWLYEFGPCSECRAKAIRAWKKVGRVDAQVLEECRLDANSAVRQLV